MAQATFVGGLVARSRDKFKLCSTVDGSYIQAKGQQLSNMLCRRQPELVLERFNNTSGVQSFDFKDEVTYFILCDPATITTVLVANRQAPAFQQSTNTQQTMQTAACQLLEEIHSEFLAMFPSEVVASASKPFQCIKFDSHLQKLMRRLTTTLMSRGGSTIVRGGAAATPGLRQTSAGTGAAAQSGGAQQPQPGDAAYDTLKKELNEVQTVLRSNLEDILSRGEKLETMSMYSAQLKDSSHTYYKRTASLNRMRLLKLYGPPAAIISLLLLWFWWYFF